jgi:hypothetical protein
MQTILVQLQQEYNKNKEGINHEKAKDGGISELFQVFSDTCLKNHHHQKQFLKIKKENPHLFSLVLINRV